MIQSLVAMQKDLLAKARTFGRKTPLQSKLMLNFQKKLEESGGFLVAPWCQSRKCEDQVKEETKATIRCLPLDLDYKMIPELKNA